MTFRLALLMTLVVGATSVARALDPHRAPTQYVHAAWQTSDGLPQNTITAIAQTADGYLWLGTRGGLARFDGVRFTVFDTETTPELTQSQILSLLADPEGRLWIGTWGGGLVRLERGRFTRFTAQQGLPSELVTALARDARGRLWVGTDGGGVARMEGERFIAEPPRGALGAQVRALAAAPDGMWIGSDSGLAHLADAGTLTSLGPEQGLSRRSVRALLRDRRGTLWVGTDQGLNEYRDGRFRAVTKADGLPHDVVMTLAEDREGSLWIGTDGGGAARMREGRIAVYASGQGLSNDSVLALHEDREGNLWLGTNLGGLNQLRDGRVAPFGRPEGLSHEYARAVYEDRAGALWFGTEGGGLVRLQDGRLTSLSSKDGLSNDTVFAIVQDRAGDLWVGTDDGLNRIRGRRVIETFHAADSHERGPKYTPGFSNDSVLALLEDRAGTLWIGTYAGGLNRYRDGRFTAFTTREGLAHDTVNVIFEDRAGALWIGTRGGGLDRYTGGRFEHFTTKEGLSDNLVFSLHEDEAGALWIGTYGGGLNRYKDGRLTTVTRRHGLHDDVIHRILEDGDGHVWLSGNRGIFRVDKRELDEVADGRRARLTSLVFGPADGMRDTECNGGASSGARTRDGHLWFPTVAGMIEIDPSRLAGPPPPPVVVESVLVDGRSVPADAPIELPRGAQTLSLNFTGLSFVVPESVRFRYRLEGHEEDWVDAGTRRTTSYSKLPPGSYRFLVSAAGQDGAWSPEAAVAIDVRPFVHQTLWFRALLVALAALVPFGVHRLRTRHLRAREVELMALVADRTAELEQQRKRAEDANRAKSTFLAHASHELRTPLTSIIGFAQFLRRDESLSDEQREHVGIIDRSGQHLLGLINDVLSLSQIEAGEEALYPTTFDPTATLRQVVEMLRARAEGKGLTVELDAGALPSRVRGDEGKLRQVLLNLASNAVKFTAKGGVVLRASWANGRAVFRVEDTGPGMSPEDVGRLFKAFAQTATGRAAREGTGLGLVISQGYARLMGGEVTVESRLGTGTTFRVEVDLPEAAVADAAPRPEAAPVTGIEGANGPVRVLVVDDTEETRRMLARLLSGVGIEVQEAADGEQALARVRPFAPHAVCMDLRMPVLDGVGAIRRLRAEEKKEGRPRTKVLAMSASAFAEERDEVFDAGADDFLAKPFREEEVFARLGRLLDVKWRRGPTPSGR